MLAIRLDENEQPGPTALEPAAEVRAASRSVPEGASDI